MITSSATDSSPLDVVAPGEPNPTPIDEIPLIGCNFRWSVAANTGVKYVVACTRERDHHGRQHVAEGDEQSGVMAVHPW